MGTELKVKTLYGDMKMKIDPGTQNEEKKKLASYVKESFITWIGCVETAAELALERQPLCDNQDNNTKEAE